MLRIMGLDQSELNRAMQMARKDPKTFETIIFQFGLHAIKQLNNKWNYLSKRA